MEPMYPNTYSQSAPMTGLLGASPTPTGGANVPIQLTQQAPSFARGGSASKRHKKMLLAHFNPHELHELDHLQGSIQRNARDGRRSYGHLEEVLKNPHIMGAVHQRAAHHRANGGRMQTAHESYGRNGDTELAYIGPTTRHLFDAFLGHQSRNPHDGHPEYWGLDDIFGGIGDALGAIPGVGGLLQQGVNSAGSLMGGLPGGLGGILKQGGNIASGLMGGMPGLPSLGGMLGGMPQSLLNAGKSLVGAAAPMVSQALPALGQMAGSALGARMGNPALGNMVGGMAGNLGSSIMNQLAPQQAPSGPGAQLGQGLGAAAQAYAQDGNMRRAMGQGMATAGQGFNNPAGRFMQDAGNAYGRGSSPQQSALSGMYGAGQQMNNPAGAFLRNASGAYGSGQGLGAAAMQGAQNAYRQFQNPDEQMYGPGY